MDHSIVFWVVWAVSWAFIVFLAWHMWHSVEATGSTPLQVGLLSEAAGLAGDSLGETLPTTSAAVLSDMTAQIFLDTRIAWVDLFPQRVQGGELSSRLLTFLRLSTFL